MTFSRKSSLVSIEMEKKEEFSELYIETFRSVYILFSSHSPCNWDIKPRERIVGEQKGFFHRLNHFFPLIHSVAFSRSRNKFPSQRARQKRFLCVWK